MNLIKLCLKVYHNEIRWFYWSGREMRQSRVGSKGELFPSKEIREKLKLYAHKRVIYKIEAGRLIVETIPSLEEVLKEKS